MEDSLKIDFIVTATGCTPDEAKLALATSEGDEKKALSTVQIIRDRFMIIKAHLFSTGIKSLEGLFFVILEENLSSPVYTYPLVINYSEEPIKINRENDVRYWHQVITANRREQNRYNIESSIELKEFIEENLIPEPAHGIWQIARDLKHLEENPDDDDANANEKKSELEKLLNSTISMFLEPHFKQSLQSETSLELHNKLRFANIAKAFGLTDYFEEISFEEEKKQEEASQKADEKDEDSVVITVKGKPVLDVTDGILTCDLVKGDSIAVDIIERSQVAENLGSMLGLKSQGYWLHTWGIIRQISNVDENQRRIQVEIARNIYVDMMTINEVRIKCKRKYPRGDRSEYVLESPSTVPGYLMVAGIALFFGLLMKIFAIIINR